MKRLVILLGFILTLTTSIWSQNITQIEGFLDIHSPFDTSSIYIGEQAGQDLFFGSRNTFIGSLAGGNLGVGGSSVFIGSSTASDVNEGSANVILGAFGASGITEMNNSVLLGFRAGGNDAIVSETLEGNILIGYRSGYNYIGNNKLFIENSAADSTGALIYGEFDNDVLRINGDFQVNGTNPDGNTRLWMQGSGGSFNEVIRYDGDNNDVVMGSVSGSGGRLFLRSNGSTRVSLIENGNLGIGTTSPESKLEISNGDIFLSDITTGVIMKSPDGDCWRVQVNNDGSFKSTEITCPGS